MNRKVIVTGHAGLIGSHVAFELARAGWTVVGIDSGIRTQLFGHSPIAQRNRSRLAEGLGTNLLDLTADIRDRERMNDIVREHAGDLEAVVHCAGQPSHEWAAGEPATDFDINAVGTLNLLEACRLHAPSARFILLSTNKVYGDGPNRLPLREGPTRWTLDPPHRYSGGIDHTLPLDGPLHGPFGISKLAADFLVRDYCSYFNLSGIVIRCGTVTGPEHTPSALHGFLAYLVHCAATGRPYRIEGYGGKQVRDVLHAADLSQAILRVIDSDNLESAAAYNLGGGPANSCSVLEAIRLVHDVVGIDMPFAINPTHRRADHLWWVTDNHPFADAFNGWTPQRTLPDIVGELFRASASL